jgi:hypothetical protein
MRQVILIIGHNDGRFANRNPIAIGNRIFAPIRHSDYERDSFLNRLNNVIACHGTIIPALARDCQGPAASAARALPLPVTAWRPARRSAVPLRSESAAA